MRLTATFFSLYLLFPGTFARLSLRESCGADAQVIDKKILVTSSGKEVTLTTKACPEFAALRNATSTPSTVRRRQIGQCGELCTSFECDTAVAQPVQIDCDQLSANLINMGGTFVSPPQSLTEATHGTCFFGFGNFDDETYSVCVSSFGILGGNLVLDCFTKAAPLDTLTAGFCLSPGLPGDDWVVESGHV